jgi:sterol desaturase/sphingolipid hydroxylase (fatty acid hydroxylase superfamily)
MFTETCPHHQAPRVPVRSFLRQDVVRAFLAALAFTLPSIIGCTVLLVLSPAKGSWTGRIGAILAIVGEVGSTAISCFIIFPLMALKLWRMKLGGAALADSNV